MFRVAIYKYCHIRIDLPAAFNIPNTFALVLFEISAFPSRSWARAPSPAVMRSLFKSKTSPGFSLKSNTCLVFPS